TLTADITQLGGSGTPAYKWFRGETPIPDATGATYTLGEDDTAGSVITVEVSRTGYTGVVKSSNSYTVPEGETPADPVLTGEVSIKETTDDEGTVTLTADITQLGGSGTPAYKWLRDGTVISGEAGATYTLGDDTAGSVITVEVSRAGYTGVKSASYTVPGEETPADPVLTGEVSIKETTDDEGTVTLTADITQLGGSGTPAYKWFRGETPIPDATGATYTLGEDDTAVSVITVEVSRAGYTGVKSASYTVPAAEED
uniref:hypothetical protein n=1 Tax=Treponema endosymbiont of Eucomonympha sp. TaxID=1580831 RepID=UPI000B25FCAF